MRICAPSAAQQIEEVIELLDSCEINREDLTESMESFKFPGVKRHSYSELDTKAKTTFTRQYVRLLSSLGGGCRCCTALSEPTILCFICARATRYNKAVHKAQGVVESSLGSMTVKKGGRGKAATADDDDALPPASDAESEPEDGDDDIDVSKFQKKPRGRAATGEGASKRKAATAGGKTKAAAPAKRQRAK